MPYPTEGGRYIRDPKTGTLVKADETSSIVQPDIASSPSEHTEPETEVAPVAIIKKGK